MSITGRWVLAVAAAAGVAVATGLTVGLLAGPPRADVRPAPAAAARAAATGATSPGGGLAEAGGGPATARPTPVTPGAAVSPAAGAGAGARGGRGFAAGAGLAGAAGVLLAALAVAALLAPAGRRRPHRPVAAATAPAPGPDPARAGAPGGDAAAPGQRAAADRAALVQACIYVRDRTTSAALADRLGAALQQAGVATVEPAGEAFDPARHEAGGTLPSRDPAQVGTIAAVEVPGYVDRGQPLRAPVVTVYQPAGGAHRTREDR
jgi:GrpE protein